MYFLAVLLVVVPNAVLAQFIGDCPEGWEPYKRHCYQFNIYPHRHFQEASELCRMNGAFLLYVVDMDEHGFLIEWLKQHSSASIQWYTCGLRNPLDPHSFSWTADGSQVDRNPQYWLNEEEQNKQGSHIVYKMKGNKIGWSIMPETSSLAYVCKIRQDETYRIIQRNRGLDYGVEVSDRNNLRRGPNMTIEAVSTIVIANTEKFATFECVAQGNPIVTYKWYKKDTVITSATDSRYTLTNGGLSIANPTDMADGGYYHCTASNALGTILGNKVQLIFGYLADFTNIEPEVVRAESYNFAIVGCPKLSFKPAVRYQWIKVRDDYRTSFIRTDKQRYIFISNNGRLYFSEITTDDGGYYICIVTLSGTGTNSLKTTQPPSRTSKYIPLKIITKAPRSDFGPTILNDFIAVFPSQPKRGQTIRMECFAMGTYRSSSSLMYSWEKVDGQLSPRVTFRDLNRALIITNAKFDDEGIYRCTVRGGQGKYDRKTYSLNLQSKPYFLLPLQSQYVDPGSRMTWRCAAHGNPTPIYSWYKNGQLLKSDNGNIEVNRNKLTIVKADENRDNGMYQCAATNIHGTSYSSAQIKIMSFAPKFIREHLPATSLAAVGGNMSLICDPDAAPRADISWSRNGNNLGLSSNGQAQGRVQKLMNGNLVIHGVTKSDAGVYKCTATNSMGSASESTILEVGAHIVITRYPSNTNVIVNETAFLYCTVSYNPYYETVHKWYFNDRQLDLRKDHFYNTGSVNNQAGLYIRNALFAQDGRYTCLVESPIDRVSASAYLTVNGPPGEVTGVHVDDTSITTDKIRIRWLAPKDNGFPISQYIVDSSSNFNPSWKMLTDDIFESAATVDGEIFKSYQLVGLLPNNMYKFRVRAINRLGVGPPSMPSAGYRTLPSPPTITPTDVGGGGGKVGDLAIVWTPLLPEEQGADGIGYVVYWRIKGNSDDKWSKKIFHEQIGKYYAFSGLNYYTLYEVKVQAVNNEGSGPNSTIASIYSAEDMPRGLPTDVVADTYNATACIVTWTPPVNNRETMRGKIAGYQVNWYDREQENPKTYSQRFFGELTECIIIGLIPNAYFIVSIQVFNSAGLGPVSEKYLGTTGMEAPMNYPTEINVFSRTGTSVTVVFRGVGFSVDETSVSGYKLCYWPVTENWGTEHCKKIGNVESGVIENLEKDKLYKLRVMAWNIDGEGKKSELRYFTLGGQVVFDPAGYRVLAAANGLTMSYLSLMFICFGYHIL